MREKAKSESFWLVLGDGAGTEGTQMGASNTHLPVPSNPA